MKKFFSEFKTFITRGNVIDMAVGVIVGSAFTAIVTALSNNILKPIINWLLALIFGANSLSEVFTFLKRTEVDGVLDLTQSIYIDWGAFINAVINFLLIALVLFSIVRLINNLRNAEAGLMGKLKGSLTAEDRKVLRERKVKLSDKAAVAAYLEEKAAAEAAAKAAEEEKAAAERAANPSVEELLKSILAELKSKG